MSAQISVFDDAISKNYQNAIKARIQDTNFPWFYVPNVSRKTKGEDRLATDTIGFAHSFYEKDKGSISFVTDLLTPLLYECCSKINMTPEVVYMARVFMTVATGKTQRNLFHTDMHTPHLVCLYYVNDSTGPTVILNKSYEDIGRDEINKKDQSKHIAREVEPKQGRVVLFNGKYFHASTNPKSGRRCIINYDVGPWK